MSHLLCDNKSRFDGTIPFLNDPFRWLQKMFRVIKIRYSEGTGIFEVAVHSSK